ncbi:uncharacterized protein LOC127565893 [Drosophila albomicans]|uniref:Uncharacterized protein LOC127565893 n=1 Tax=Drosophila albomicans TaxID=7291 RepID=A0A9C6T762_DROAB|nr:uncharacterized protein LOC127565893 [Drosophila albomicans]
MTCVVCGNAATFMCQRCNEPYCQASCQRSDWQRHKYFCTTMPPLITRTADAMNEGTSKVDGSVKSLEKSISNCSIDYTASEAKNDNTSSKKAESIDTNLSCVWRTKVLPNANEFFECRITYVSNNGAIWVVESSNIERLERLTQDMVLKDKCRMENLGVGDLVGVNWRQQFYRGDIMQMQPKLNCVRVRLIDRGCIIKLDIDEIYLAVPLMAEIEAFAFKVMLPQNVEHEFYENKTICLRLLGTKNQDGILLAELKDTSAPLELLPLQMLAKNAGVSWLKNLETNVEREEPQVALMQIKELNQLNEQLESILNGSVAQPFNIQFPNAKLPIFVAARTKQGLRRAFLIDFIQEPIKYLIYEVDEGCFSIVHEVLRIPNEMFALPLRTFAIMLPKEHAIGLSDLKDLAIEFDEVNMENARGTLLAHNEKICAVRVASFTGQFAKELNCKYFCEPIASGSLVYITNVVNYQEICISSVKTKEYSNIFTQLQQKCAPFANTDEIEVGSIVLVICPNRGAYRAEVKSKSDNENYRVLNIDTGIHHLVTAAYLRKSCAFLEHLPVSLCRSNIKNICTIPSTAVPPNTSALNLLINLYEKKSELLVEFSDSTCSTLDLVGFNEEPHSLMTRMLPLMFTSEAAPVPISALPPLPPSPPSTPCPALALDAKAKPIKRHYFDDMKHELLPFNEEISVMILSAVDMQKTGFVFGCYFANEKVAENFQNLLNLVAEIGLSDQQLLPGYIPNVGEMCLAVFSEDNSWYRGVCIEVSYNEANILFCDYGNTAIVSIENIKPIPAKLVKPIFTTKCFIDGFDKSGKFKLLEDYLIAKNKINCIASLGSEPNTCLIRIPTLDKILSKELV